jgi:hypothetical protein
MASKRSRTGTDTPSLKIKNIEGVEAANRGDNTGDREGDLIEVPLEPVRKYGAAEDVEGNPRHFELNLPNPPFLLSYVELGRDRTAPIGDLPVGLLPNFLLLLPPSVELGVTDRGKLAT